MKKYLTIIKRDLLYTLLEYKKTYIYLVIFYLFLNFIIVYRYTSAIDNDIFTILIKGYGGIEFISLEKKIDIPIIWIIIHILIIILTTNIVSKNFNTSSKYILTRIESRNLFWISKIISIIFSVLLYYSIVFISFFVISFLFSNFLSINFKSLLGEYNFNIFLIKIIFLYIINSILLCTLSSTIGVLVDFKYAIVILVLIMIISLTGKSALLPAQGSIILRHAPYSPDGINVIFLVTYNIVLSFILIILGCNLIDKKDII